MKIFDIFKSKEQIYQEGRQKWASKMATVVPQELAMELSIDEIHNRVRLATVSQNCMNATEDYFEIIAPLCPIRGDIAHSLLRIAIRPLYYMWIDYSTILSEVERINKDKPAFLCWLNDNKDMLKTIVNELDICCEFYALTHDHEKNIVILNQDCDAVTATDGTIVLPARYGKSKEFSSFDDYKAYFYSSFSEYNISQDELDRLMLEEGYKDKYFDLMLIKSEHWGFISPRDRQSWYMELEEELDKKHPLYRKSATPIARCYGQDDVLYKYSDGTCAIVHLTYSNKNEKGFPRFVEFNTLEDATKHIMAMEC